MVSETLLNNSELPWYWQEVITIHQLMLVQIILSDFQDRVIFRFEQTFKSIVAMSYDAAIDTCKILWT